MKITFRFRLVLKLRLTPIVECLKNMYMNIYVSSTHRFMVLSLDKLVSYLPAENFSLLDNHFPEHCSDFFQLLHQKEFDPYSRFYSHGKFHEKWLPSVENWTNCLQDGRVPITPVIFQHAAKVIQKFGCDNFVSYHDLYLTTDTLLFDCMLEQFRKVTFSA